MDIGRASIQSGCFFGGVDIRIGEGTFVNVGCVFDNSAPVRVGSGCSLGHGVRLVTSTHQIGAPHQRAGALDPLPVTISDGCWLGAGVTVLPGVTVEAGCVIAAGAVVAEDCEANGLYAGIPARRLRELSLA